MKTRFIAAAVTAALALSQACAASPLSDWYNGKKEKTRAEQPGDTGLTGEDASVTYPAEQVKLKMTERKITSPSFGNAVVGRTMIPEGWSVNVTDLFIGTESVTCPNAVLLRASDSAGECELVFLSRREYEQQLLSAMGYQVPSTDDSYDAGSLMHMLDYREAGDACDLMASVMYGDGLSFVREIPLTDEEEEITTRARDAYDTETRNAVAQSGLLAPGQGVEWTDVTLAKRTYSDGNDLVTVYAASSGFRFAMEGYGFETETVFWAMPAVFMLRTPADVHDGYSEAFDVFCAATAVSSEYEQFRTLNSERLVSELIAARNSGTSYTPSGDFSDSGETTIDTGDTYTAMDGWDDVILDRTDYTTGDGSHIKVPTAFDHVFEGDNGTIYVGNSADGPVGSVELSPTQISE